MQTPKHLLNNSLGYRLFRYYLSFCHNKIFYRQVIVQNFPTHLPTDSPLLILPNHQNTLMDALAVLFNVGAREPVFLARADIFKNSTLRKILTFLKILPVYRLRDGVAEMQQNEVIFDQCVELLQHKRTLVIFPEGEHTAEYKLRPLKKGAARIALKTETNSHWTAALQILPCGLHYTHCKRMGEVLTINFGQPFAITHLKEIYQQNPAKANNELTKQISTAIDTLMKEIVVNKKNVARPDRLASTCTTLLLFKTIKVIILLITSPLAFYGWVNNVIPFSIPLLVTQRLKDKQFSTSVRYVMYSLLTFPIFYVLQTLLMSQFLSGQWLLLYLLSLPVTGYVAHRWGQAMWHS
jgi:1-acyl-sn-glycerol-3-phosphate acyltransferase